MEHATRYSCRVFRLQLVNSADSWKIHWKRNVCQWAGHVWKLKKLGLGDALGAGCVPASHCTFLGVSVSLALRCPLGALGDFSPGAACATRSQPDFTRILVSLFGHFSPFFSKKTICTLSPWLIYLTQQTPLGTKELNPPSEGGVLRPCAATHFLGWGCVGCVPASPLPN